MLRKKLLKLAKLLGNKPKSNPKNQLKAGLFVITRKPPALAGVSVYSVARGKIKSPRLAERR